MSVVTRATIVAKIVAVTTTFIFALARPSSAKCLQEWVQQDRRFGPTETTTMLRKPVAGDANRATRLIAAIRAVLEYYSSPFATQAVGYQVSDHLSEGNHYEVVRIGAHPLAFDLRLPAALIYVRSQSSRDLVLVGARYTAPSEAQADFLNSLFPLSVTRWARILPRCVAVPSFYPWIVDVFPFERDAAQIWRVPTSATYVAPYIPWPMPSTMPGQTLPRPTPWPTAPPILIPDRIDKGAERK